MIDVGAYLRNKRICSGLSNKEVSSAIGVSLRTIQRWEATGRLSTVQLSSLCQLYQVNPFSLSNTSLSAEQQRRLDFFLSSLNVSDT